MSVILVQYAQVIGTFFRGISHRVRYGFIAISHLPNGINILYYIKRAYRFCEYHIKLFLLIPRSYWKEIMRERV